MHAKNANILHYKSYIKITFPCFDSFKFGTPNNAHLGLHFPKILWNFKKLRELCSIISQFFSQFVVAPNGCIINAMGLKIFPNTIMLLKVDRFEGFSN